MPQTTKYNFMPADSVKRKKVSKAFVSISTTGCIIFNRACLENYDLANKYIRFYTDTSKNVLGWQIINTLNEFKDMKNKKYRIMKVSKNHTSSLSIRNILQEFDLKVNSLHKLQVREYVDTLYNKIYYITLHK